MGSTVCYVLRLTEVRLPFKFVQNGEVSRQGPNFEEKEKNANSKRLGNLILLQEKCLLLQPRLLLAYRPLFIVVKILVGRLRVLTKALAFGKRVTITPVYANQVLQVSCREFTFIFHFDFKR